ncbi:hypothetical protein [Pedobacter glucosidilyticus]|uniref:hypothetical protein n=1 Tax=Pedobacter glucosidilyticus TaxID=1122941 RepID=UPI0026F14C95|nr:hypothetical protein [Pedobacter glucosidilyticus]
MRILSINIIIVFLLAKVATAQQDTMQTKHWLIPKSVITQYAGSIGYLSAGVGYNLNKSGNSTLDIHYGHVPASKGGSLHIVTAKFAYRPFHVKINQHTTLSPLNPGFFLSYHAGSNFDSTWDDNNYPKGYYWWSTAFRPHLSLSTELSLKSEKKLKSIGIKKLSFYSEFNTNELYFVSLFQNSTYLKLHDIFKLGFGSRIYF